MIRDCFRETFQKFDASWVANLHRSQLFSIGIDLNICGLSDCCYRFSLEQEFQDEWQQLLVRDQDPDSWRSFFQVGNCQGVALLTVVQQILKFGRCLHDKLVECLDFSQIDVSF